LLFLTLCLASRDATPAVIDIVLFVFVVMQRVGPGETTLRFQKWVGQWYWHILSRGRVSSHGQNLLASTLSREVAAHLTRRGAHAVSSKATEAGSRSGSKNFLSRRVGMAVPVIEWSGRTVVRDELRRARAGESVPHIH
jgi:hypothetical protein